jgi:VWFA-related protein
MKRCRAIAFATALSVSAPAAHAQNEPRFQSSVEVTPIEVTIVDGRDRAISDLKSAEFIVQVDGMPRRVVSAEWIPRTSKATAARRGPLESFRSDTPSSSGRLIVIVIDQPNIRFGGTISLRAAINEFIDRLDPSDRISVVNLGIGARSIALTTNRDQAKEVVSSSTGGVPYPPSNKTNGEITLSIIRALMNDLRSLDAPKTILLVSQELIFNEDARPSFVELERLAAEARTRLYALRLDQRISYIRKKYPDPEPGSASPNASASARRNGGRSQQLPGLELPDGPAGDRGATGLEAAGELYAVANATGGATFNIVMAADAALARIESELEGYYLLGVESIDSDRDHMSHSLTVDTSRRGVSVRAGRYLP